MKKHFLTFCLILLNLSTLTQTFGTLTFSFTPTSHVGYSGTKNLLAVWIQTPSGTFVKTKLRYVGWNTADHLPTWAVASGGSSWNALASSCNTTDATTGATLPNFTPKTITWDGRGVNGSQNGAQMPDGNYKVVIQETWNHGGGTTLRSFTFTKGPNPDTQTPSDNTHFTNISLNWTPSPASVPTNNSNPKLVTYPNPSSGTLTVNYENSVNIMVVNVTGEIIYNENVTSNGKGAQTIDLHSYANGFYTVVVKNAFGMAKSKILLEK